MSRPGTAAVAFALAIAMLGTTLPTPLYSLYREQFGFSELMITVIFATVRGGRDRLAGPVRPPLRPGRAPPDAAARARPLRAQRGRVPARRRPSPPARRPRALRAGGGIFTGTATATLVDLAAPGRRARATLVATIANMGGLGLGPLLAGLLAQWAGSPLQVTFWVYLALLVPAAFGIWAMPEPVTARTRPRLRLQAPTVPVYMRADVPPGGARGLCRVRGARPVHALWRPPSSARSSE